MGSAQGGAANHTGRHGAPGKRRSAQSWCSWLRAETTAAGVHSSWTCSTRQPAVKLEGRKLRGPQSGPGCDEPLACVGAAAAREQRRCGPCARVAARCVLGGLGPRGAGPPPAQAPCPVISSARNAGAHTHAPSVPCAGAQHRRRAPAADRRHVPRALLAQEACARSASATTSPSRALVEHLVVNDYYLN